MTLQKEETLSVVRYRNVPQNAIHLVNGQGIVPSARTHRHQTNLSSAYAIINNNCRCTVQIHRESRNDMALLQNIGQTDSRREGDDPTVQLSASNVTELSSRTEQGREKHMVVVGGELANERSDCAERGSNHLWPRILYHLAQGLCLRWFASWMDSAWNAAFSAPLLVQKNPPSAGWSQAQPSVP